MVIIRGQRVAFIFIAVLISIAAYFKMGVNSNEIIQTSSQVASGKTIVIDAGHGLPDGGSIRK